MVAKEVSHTAGRASNISRSTRLWICAGSSHIRSIAARQYPSDPLLSLPLQLQPAQLRFPALFLGTVGCLREILLGCFSTSGLSCSAGLADPCQRTSAGGGGAQLCACAARVLYAGRRQQLCAVVVPRLSPRLVIAGRGMSLVRSVFTRRGRVPGRAGPLRLRAIGAGVRSEMAPQSQLVFWRRLWDIIIGSDEEESQKWEVIFFACIFYYAFIMVVARLLRRLSRRHLPSELTPYLLDFITTFQVCACSLENGFIFKAYGRSYLLITIAITSMWCFLTLGKSSGNPCANFARFLSRQLSLRQFLFRAAFQLTAALLAFKFARLWWGLGATSQHSLRASMLSCSSDLRVSVLTGFLIEMAATTTDSLFGLLMFGQSFLKHERFQQLCCVVLGVCMTASGIHLTGMYINPANATTQTFGCNGSHAWEHIFVYWLGPFSGTWLAFRIHSHFQGCNICEKILETPLVAAVDPRPIFKVVDSFQSSSQECATDGVRQRTIST